MEKTSYIACPIEECRERLGNVGVGYRSIGTDVYRFNSVQKKGSGYSFYAKVTLTASGADGTDVTLVLSPDEESGAEPSDINGDYELFTSRFFRALSQPAQDPFAEYGNTENSGNFSGATKHCVRCGAVIDEKAVICPKCGCSQRRDYMVEKTSAVGIAAIIFAILGGWLGIVLSLFGLLYYYKGSDDPVSVKGIKHCKIALGIVIAWVAFVVIYYIVIFALMGSSMAGF